MALRTCAQPHPSASGTRECDYVLQQKAAYPRESDLITHVLQQQGVAG